MLAPAIDPYNFGTHNMTCTCPLVEVTEPYLVAGGLQNPCSTEPTGPGDYVQAAGGVILEKLAEQDEDTLQSTWATVDVTFKETVYATSANRDSTSSADDTVWWKALAGALISVPVLALYY